MRTAAITRRLSLQIGAATVLFGGRAWSQDKKLARIIVPFPSGGNADIFARLVAQRLETKLNQTVIVESKPGAGTMIGSEFVARAAPDGLTLLLTSASLLTLLLSKKRSLRFDVVKDLTPVSLAVTLPLVVLCGPDDSFKSLSEMIAWAKARPGQLNVGTGPYLISHGSACSSWPASRQQLSLMQAEGR